MKTVDAARGRWEEILPHFKLSITRNRHIECPLCNRKGSSGMRINEYSGQCGYICVCGSGSIFNLLCDITGRDFVSIANEIDIIIGNTSDIITQPKKQITQTQHISIKGTESERYLLSRGLKIIPSMSVSHVCNMPFYNDGVRVDTMPAMKSIITDSLNFEILQEHYTYLKSGSVFSRKIRGISETEFRSPVIKLMGHNKTLGIAEGIETALSACQLFSVPTWSTVNAGYMKKFRAPKGVTKLIIFADNDNSLTGQSAAYECARANLAANNDVSEIEIWITKERGDFNDIKNLDECKLIEHITK